MSTPSQEQTRPVCMHSGGIEIHTLGSVRACPNGCRNTGWGTVILRLPLGTTRSPLTGSFGDSGRRGAGSASSCRANRRDLSSAQTTGRTKLTPATCQVNTEVRLEKYSEARSKQLTERITPWAAKTSERRFLRLSKESQLLSAIQCGVAFSSGSFPSISNPYLVIGNPSCNSVPIAVF